MLKATLEHNLGLEGGIGVVTENSPAANMCIACCSLEETSVQFAWHISNNKPSQELNQRQIPSSEDHQFLQAGVDSEETSPKRCQGELLCCLEHAL